jgi:hypothetical protein
MTDRDPNEGSTDPMEPDFWLLGEAVQDKILAAGYEAESVEGIAVDIHDLLQAADRIRLHLGPALLESQDKDQIRQALEGLKFEFDHVRWHGASARDFLTKALEKIG